MTIQWVPVVCDKMAPWAYFLLVSGILIEASRAHYCLGTDNEMISAQEDISFVCGFTVPGNPSQQCDPHDLTTLFQTERQYSGMAFWIEKGNLCTGLSCPAVVVNTSDPVAYSSIQCLLCTENHTHMCKSDGECTKGTTLPLLSTHDHTGSCPNDWERHNDKEYMISPVRRTLKESQSWCTMMNGSSFHSNEALKYVEHMTLPHPKMPYYWIAVPDIGQVLTTNKDEGNSFTNTFNIIDQGADTAMLYGCICIRKNGNATSTPMASTATTTAQTTTKTTTKTTTVKTTTPNAPQNHASGVKLGKYKNVPPINGYFGSLEKAFTVRRSLECAMACDRKTTCKSYFFDKESSTCRLNDQKYNEVSSLTAMNKAKYFERYQ